MNLQKESIIISGIGSYAPKKVVTNDDLSQRMDTSDEWIRTRSGIRERHIAASGESASDMAVEAALIAIKQAKIAKEDIDLVIVGTMTPDLPFPSTASIIQNKLGLRPVPAFDLSAACSGFVYMLETATQMLRGGHYKHALIVGTEKFSSVLDWEDRRTCVLFGDAAGACVLSKSAQPHVGVIDNLLGSDGAYCGLLYMPAGGSSHPATHETVEQREHFLRMNGKEIFKHAVKIMEKTILDLLERNQMTPADVQLVVPHQANIRIIEALATRLEIPLEKVAINIDRYGNTSAASIPIALCEAYEQGRIQPGNHVVLVAFGAGLTWGGSLIRWHG